MTIIQFPGLAKAAKPARASGARPMSSELRAEMARQHEELMRCRASAPWNETERPVIEDLLFEALRAHPRAKTWPESSTVVWAEGPERPTVEATIAEVYQELAGMRPSRGIGEVARPDAVLDRYVIWVRGVSGLSMAEAIRRAMPSCCAACVRQVASLRYDRASWRWLSADPVHTSAPQLCERCGAQADLHAAVAELLASRPGAADLRAATQRLRSSSS